MIEVTDEMRVAFDAAISAPARVELEDDQLDACLAAVLAIVERDHCLKPRGHVFHPLARPRTIPHCPVVDDLCPGDSRGVLCLTSCRGG